MNLTKPTVRPWTWACGRLPLPVPSAPSRARVTCWRLQSPAIGSRVPNHSVRRWFGDLPEGKPWVSMRISRT